MPKGYLYTHKVLAIGVGGPVKGKRIWVEVRKLRKWWVTCDIGRFDAYGNDKYMPYYWWRLDIDTLKKI